jgi:predicted type IV restriction endonuclease
LDVSKAIAEALEHSDSPPPNESNTCEWVILPILYELGYKKREVVSRDADSAGKFPDYTLLPNLPEHTFYLEAKAWKVNLEDSHANQALNYANQNGKRWVVLANGRQWRLYDNDKRGLATAKLVTEVSLDAQDGAIRLLTAISRESVCSGRLPEFAEEERDRRRVEEVERTKKEAQESRRKSLKAVLDVLLKDPNKGLIGRIVEHVQGVNGLESVDAVDVVEYFQRGFVPTPSTSQNVVSPFTGKPQTSRPTGDSVLVIAARHAWPEYQRFSVYICQPRRKFRPTSHLAFYTHKAVQPIIPRIQEVVEEVVLSENQISAANDLDDSTKRRLVTLIRELKRNGVQRRWEKPCKVVFLSPHDSAESIILPQRIMHDRAGAFTQGQRYVRLSRVRQSPKTTTELLEDG